MDCFERECFCTGSWQDSGHKRVERYEYEAESMGRLL